MSGQIPDPYQAYAAKLRAFLSSKSFNRLQTITILLLFLLAFYRYYQEQNREAHERQTPQYQQALQENIPLRNLVNQYIMDPIWEFIGQAEFFLGPRKISQSNMMREPLSEQYQITKWERFGGGMVFITARQEAEDPQSKENSVVQLGFFNLVTEDPLPKAMYRGVKQGKIALTEISKHFHHLTVKDYPLMASATQTSQQLDAFAHHLLEDPHWAITYAEGKCKDNLWELLGTEKTMIPSTACITTLDWATRRRGKATMQGYLGACDNLLPENHGRCFKIKLWNLDDPYAKKLYQHYAKNLSSPHTAHRRK